MVEARPCSHIVDVSQLYAAAAVEAVLFAAVKRVVPLGEKLGQNTAGRVMLMRDLVREKERGGTTH